MHSRVKQLLEHFNLPLLQAFPQKKRALALWRVTVLVTQLEVGTLTNKHGNAPL